MYDSFYEWQRDKRKDKKPFYIYPYNGNGTEETKENVNTKHFTCIRLVIILLLF